MLVRTWTNMFGFQELFAGVHVFELNASVSKPLGRCSDLSPPICPICPICPIACSWFILSAKACLLTGSYTDISLFQVNAPRGKHSRSLDFSEALDPPPSDSEARLVPRQVSASSCPSDKYGLRSQHRQRFVTMHVLHALWLVQ